MRRPFVVLFLITPLLASSAAPASEGLLLHPVGRADPRASGRRPPPEPLTSEESRGLVQRLQRWRAQSDVITRPGVDWSRWAARSRAARMRPAFGRVRPLAAEGAAGAATPLGPPDTIRVALLRVDFLADRGGDASTGNGRFDLTPADTNAVPIDRPPRNRDYFLEHLEALHRFYYEQSYGRTVVVGDVYPSGRDSAYHMTDMADFGPWAFSQDIYGAALSMFKRMLAAADSQSIALGERIPWDQIDRVVVIHAGSDLQSDVRQDSPEDIPSFTLGVSDTDAVVMRDLPNPGDSVVVDRAAFVPESATQDGYYGAINGVLAHECGHLLFGLADLYNVETGFPVVGFWSLMDSGNLVGARVQLKNGDEIFAVGLLPPSVDPLQRFFCTDTLEFLTPPPGARDTLGAGERHPDMRKVLLSSDEYLLLENRYVPNTLTVQLAQDSATRVILGPPVGDSTAYDVLLPGGGVLVWHIDESVAFAGGLRENPDFGVNTNPLRPGIAVVEADGLNDLGDPSSALALGSPYDPYFLSNNPLLDDDTTPNTLTWSRTRPHVRVQFLDDPDTLMTLVASHLWALPGWPVAADFPPGGPRLLTVDADGDRRPDIAWVGGADSLVVPVKGGADTLVANPDSTALFVWRADGKGIYDTTAVVYRFPRRPFPEAAALPLGEEGSFGAPTRGPSLFAVSTRPAGADTSAAGGRVYLVDHLGNLQPGWPPALPSPVTTPPLIAGSVVNPALYVGCADGFVYKLDLAGQVLAVSGARLPGGVHGRLAVYGGGNPAPAESWIAAASDSGFVTVLDASLTVAAYAWPMRVSAPLREAPGLLWVSFDSPARPVGQSPLCGTATQSLVVQLPNTLLAFCPSGTPLSGWGQTTSDTLISGMAAGDVDGDGYNEVVTQTRSARLAYWNVTGAPSPGWPRQTTREGFPSGAAPLAVDVDGDGRPELVGLNGSGTLAAQRADGSGPDGWPLASGVGATGSPCFADLNQDGRVEVVVPDRAGRLWAYSLPIPFRDPVASPWPMLGGDPGRSFALLPGREPSPAAAGPQLVASGSLMAYPNPARRRPVNFAYRLSDPGEVEFIILDASGHEVARFTRPSNRADNVVRWDPGSLPAGLYLARLHFRGGGRDQVEILPVGLLR